MVVNNWMPVIPEHEFERRICYGDEENSDIDFSFVGMRIGYVVVSMVTMLKSQFNL